MEKLKAIIVEDEESSQQALKNMLEDYCQNIVVTGMAVTVDGAIELINKQHPDIIFLDIELPGKTGFKLFDSFTKPDFEVIFTTAYDKYAVKAFKMSAIDYLLKPIDLEELRAAIEKAQKQRKLNLLSQKIQIFKDHMSEVVKKLALPTQSGIVFVELEDIVRCEATGSYTIFYLQNGDTVLVSKTLKIYVELLEDFNFCRINRRDLINLKFVKEYRRQNKGMVVMSDGAILSVSEGRKETYLKKMGFI